MAERLVLEPTFIISLDVELLWGAVLHPKEKIVDLMIDDEKKSRGNIDLLLSLFEKHNIPATWALVGHLFLDRCQKENGIPHPEMPRFKDGWYSVDPCSDIEQDPLYYGRDIIEKVMASPVGHEIGYHSFSHVPFSECSREVAEAEVEAGLRVAGELGIALESFVFPYNKIGHVDVLKEKGFKIYRGQDLGTVMGQIHPMGMVARAINKIVPPAVEPKWMGGIWEIPSSMPCVERAFHLPLLPRARMGIHRAIRWNKVFHIWLHPHDLLSYPPVARELDRLLAFVSEKRDEGKLTVATMGKLASYLNSKLEVPTRRAQ
jgi:peptidoglycan/xylan/chitin deacetylase (PgdA/CDA1 family)